MRGRHRLQSSFMDCVVFSQRGISHSNSSPLSFLNPVWPGRGEKCDPELDGWLWGKEEDPRRLMCAESLLCFSHSSLPVRTTFFIVFLLIECVLKRICHDNWHFPDKTLARWAVTFDSRVGDRTADLALARLSHLPGAKLHHQTRVT